MPEMQEQFPAAVQTGNRSPAPRRRAAFFVAPCSELNQGSGGLSQFQTTRWSLVLEARAGDARSRAALEQLCRTYRAPVIAYIRSRGTSPVDVEDLTQTFFVHFVERAFHARADPARGRFRAYLLTAVKNFLADAREEAGARKRGGDIQFRALDSTIGDDSRQGSIADNEMPEAVFDRAWAQAVLQAALHKLRKEAKAAGKSALFDALSEFLVERPDEADYTRVAAALNLRRNTLAVAVHRMRNRLRDLVCEELAQTAADDENLEQELDDLRGCLSSVL